MLKFRNAYAKIDILNKDQYFEKRLIFRTKIDISNKTRYFEQNSIFRSKIDIYNQDRYFEQRLIFRTVKKQNDCLVSFYREKIIN